MKRTHSPKLWLGEDGSRIIQDHSSDHIMDSTINYYEEEKPKVKYKYLKLFLDNGAYTANRKGIELEREKVIELQEEIWPDITIPLDYPFRAGETIDILKRKWIKTVRNIIFWQSSTRLGGRLAPALHGWSWGSLRKNALLLQKISDSNMICLGSMVNLHFVNKRYYFGDRVASREFVSLLFKTIRIVKENTDFRVHVMGCGSSPLSLHMAYWLGADSVDSAGHRRRAAYGNIILLGTSDRYVGGREGKFVSKRLSPKEREILSECTCATCRKEPGQLWKSWEARAIHNRHVIKLERDRAEKWLSQGRDIYEEKLEAMYSQSGSYPMWRLARMLLKYPSIRSYSGN